jgi:hypothetical protein
MEYNEDDTNSIKLMFIDHIMGQTVCQLLHLHYLFI